MDLTRAASVPKTLCFFHRLLLCGLLLTLSGCQMLYTPMVRLSCATQPSLELQPDTLPPAQQSQPYHVVIRIPDSVTPVASVSLESGELPDGVELIVTEAPDDNLSQPGIRLAGIAEEAGVFDFTLAVRAYGSQCTGQSGRQAYRLLSRASD